MDGVVHHALAFNTLLSSQETDAYIPAPNPDQGRAAEALISYLDLNGLAYFLSNSVNLPTPILVSDLNFKLQLQTPKDHGTAFFGV